MDQKLKHKSIVSWVDHYEGSRYKVWADIPWHHKPPEINGVVPDVFAMRKGSSVAICIRDDEELTKNPHKYELIREWTYAPTKTFIIAEPGEWPNILYTIY